MKKIKILNEFMHSPLWYCDEDGIEWENELEFSVFINDTKLQKIAKNIEEKFNNYYEFDSHNQPCWFNAEKEILEKNNMLSLLNSRLSELNDGSFEIVDLETSRVEKL